MITNFKIKINNENKITLSTYNLKQSLNYINSLNISENTKKYLIKTINESPIAAIPFYLKNINTLMEKYEKT